MAFCLLLFSKYSELIFSLTWHKLTCARVVAFLTTLEEDTLGGGVGMQGRWDCAESLSVTISLHVMEKILQDLELLVEVDLALFSLNKAVNELLENLLEDWEVIFVKKWFGLVCFLLKT